MALKAVYFVKLKDLNQFFWKDMSTFLFFFVNKGCKFVAKM